MTAPGPIAERMRVKLEQALEPSLLELLDDSARHAGHAGASPQGETHFRVRMVAPAFAGRTRLERHRMIHSLLAEELSGHVHALNLDLKAPGEP